ncbi:MAG TPA: IS110 family transposase [Methylomirabilota bacterium]|jgi:transposase
MLADELDFVIGIDTHRDTHALALVEASTGALVLEREVGADGPGYRQALALADGRAPGARVWAIEGTGSYGAGLARFLLARGERVVEVARPRREGRARAKTDALDALRAARTVLARGQLADPRAGGQREGLRALMTTREGLLKAKRAALCQLRALVVACPEPLRAELRTLTRARLLDRLATLRLDRRGDSELRGLYLSLRALARHAQTLTVEERTFTQEIGAHVDELAPALLREPGIGPISAAQLLISWSHPGRLHSEAAFAHLAGAAPIPASSGQTVRHRLDPGGDRQLNRALHTIIITRRKNHDATTAYIERRTAEGKTVREAIRCLKRYLARHLYRLLERTPLTT